MEWEMAWNREKDGSRPFYGFVERAACPSAAPQQPFYPLGEQSHRLAAHGAVAGLQLCPRHLRHLAQDKLRGMVGSLGRVDFRGRTIAGQKKDRPCGRRNGA